MDQFEAREEIRSKSRIDYINDLFTIIETETTNTRIILYQNNTDAIKYIIHYTS